MDTVDTYPDDSGESGKERSGSKCKGCKANLMLPMMFLIAMICGVSIGFIVRAVDPSFTDDNRKLMYLGYPGEIMLNMLKGIILPLIVSSMIAGVGALPVGSAGKLGGRMVAYYMGTTLIAVVIGIIYVTSIQPGNIGDDEEITVGVERSTYTNPVDSLLDLIRNLFPNNLIVACFNQFRTTAGMSVMETEWARAKVVLPNGTEIFHNTTMDLVMAMNATAMNTSAFSVEVLDSHTIVTEKETVKVVMAGNMNTLGIIVFSIAFGIMLSRMGERGRPLLHIFELIQDVVIRIVMVIIWYCPIGITFLLASKIVQMKDPATSFTQLAYYMATVIVGLATHFFIILPLLYFIFTRKNPFKFMAQMSPALFLAVSTASSSATMPVTLKSLRERARVNPLVSNFMIPVGATINMDGTALYEAVASIFIAQYNDIHLDVGQIIIVAITATAAAIGAAGVPEAGLVTMLIVLTAVGLPVGDVGLIYAVDWFLDRLRTTLNVWGDSVGAAILAHRLKDDLDEADFEIEEKADKPPPSYNDAYVVSNNGIISSSYL